MNGFVGLCVVLLAVWCLCSSGSGSTAGRSIPRRGLTGHVHSGPRSTVATHEGGHVVVARGVGGRVKSARIYSDGSGLVTWTGAGKTDYEQVVNAVAFLQGGRYAAGTSEGCGDGWLFKSGDALSVEQVLKYLPTDQRAKARAEGERKGARIVSSRGGEIARVADRLDQRGRI